MKAKQVPLIAEKPWIPMRQPNGEYHVAGMAIRRRTPSISDQELLDEVVELCTAINHEQQHDALIASNKALVEALHAQERYEDAENAEASGQEEIIYPMAQEDGCSSLSVSQYVQHLYALAQSLRAQALAQARQVQ